MEQQRDKKDEERSWETSIWYTGFTACGIGLLWLFIDYLINK
jgi:hypothetical protein